MRFYRFEVDGRPCGPMRIEWDDAAQDAVDHGMAVWVSKRVIKTADNLGAAIARIDVEDKTSGPNLRTK